MPIVSFLIAICMIGSGLTNGRAAGPVVAPAADPAPAEVPLVEPRPE